MPDLLVLQAVETETVGEVLLITNQYWTTTRAGTKQIPSHSPLPPASHWKTHQQNLFPDWSISCKSHDTTVSVQLCDQQTVTHQYLALYHIVIVWPDIPQTCSHVQTRDSTGVTGQGSAGPYRSVHNTPSTVRYQHQPLRTIPCFHHWQANLPSCYCRYCYSDTRYSVLQSEIFRPGVFRAAEEPGNKSRFSPAPNKTKFAGCWLRLSLCWK